MAWLTQASVARPLHFNNIQYSEVIVQTLKWYGRVAFNSMHGYTFNNMAASYRRLNKEHLFSNHASILDDVSKSGVLYKKSLTFRDKNRISQYSFSRKEKTKEKSDEQDCNQSHPGNKYT